MTVPPKISARASASADLPLAVGPAITSTGGNLRASVITAGIESATSRRNNGLIGLRRVGVNPGMFELTFLGTAASVPSPERGLPAVLISAGSERFLVDCGEGTQRQLLRSGVGFRRLGHILLTHLHLDHVLGLAGLLSTLAMFDVRGALTIHGSRETIGFVARYLRGIWPSDRAPVPVRLVTLEPGPVFAGRGYRVTCFPVRHHQTQSLGYLFETTS